METMKYAATLAGYITTILALLTLLCSPIRNAFIKFLKYIRKEEEEESILHDILKELQSIKDDMIERKKNEEIERDALRCELRNTITHLYYKYMNIGEIPSLERENVSFLCNAYFSLDGNSYVRQCYEELMDLPVKS